jgi:carbonic anhydrase
VHGWIYRLSDGRIRDLGMSVSANESINQCREAAVTKLMSKPPLWL